MSKPRLLDLFCGAGGAAMGYHRAGFEVVGVDIAPQPHYPFEFHQVDALEVLDPHHAWLLRSLHRGVSDLSRFDAIHASPPCQGYSRMRHLKWLRDRQYPLLVAPTWKACEESGIPFVIENVEDCWEFPSSSVICGWSLGLPMYRHRRFGGSLLIGAPGHRKHLKVIRPGRHLNARYHGGPTGILPSPAGHTSMHGQWPAIREAMGIDWMTRDELTQAIPPAYTEYIGQQLMAHLGR